MLKSGQSSVESVGRGWKAAKACLMAALTLLSSVGVAAIVLLVNHSQLIPNIPIVEAFKVYFDKYGPGILSAAKFIVQSGGFAAFGVALLIAMMKIDKVIKLMSDFTQSKGQIFELANTLSSIRDLSQTLSVQSEKMSSLQPVTQSIAAKIEVALKEIAELQLTAASDANSTPENQEDQNLEVLRSYWRANCRRIDAIRQNIADPDLREKYAGMPRTNYEPIISGLADADIIPDSAKKASLQLNSTFMSYKNRTRAVTDQTIGAMSVLDGQLEVDLVKALSTQKEKHKWRALLPIRRSYWRGFLPA